MMVSSGPKEKNHTGIDAYDPVREHKEDHFMDQLANMFLPLDLLLEIR